MKISKRLGKRFLAVLLVVAIVVPLVVFNGGFDTSAATTTASVNASSLNVRSGPGTNYGVTASVTKGTTVTILSIGSNGWNQVQLPNGKTGYVSASYLTMSSASESTPIDGASTSTGTVINATLLNVRSGPGTNYGVKTGIAGGTQVTVISTSNGWSKIVLSNGIEGYVSSSYLSIKNGATTTTTTIPAVPTGLAISSITTTGATFKWNAVSGATEYQVNVSGGWVTVTGANTTTHVRTGLKANTSYDYCVRAKNAAGYSAWSAYGYFKTTSTSTPVATVAPTTKPTTVPAVPTGLAISNITTTGATFKWNAVSGATEYQVNVSGGWVTVTGANTTTHNRTGLKANTSYDYCIRSKNAIGYSAWSSYGYFKTTSTSTPVATPAPVETLPPANSKPTTVPAVPTGLAISNITTTGATFKWNAVSGATEYQVNVSGGWTTVAGANTTTFSHTTLKANTSYDYCIRAKNAVGYGAWSAYGYFKTTSTSTPVATVAPTTKPTTVPAIPTGLAISNITTTGATFKWNAVSGATEYQVNVSGGWVTVAGQSNTTHNRTGLKANTSYDYCVRAKNAVGYSAWSSYGYFKTTSTSNPVATTAPTTVPAVPTGVSVSSIGATEATFKWNAVSGVTGYQVNVSGGWTDVTGTATTFTHKALKASTSYDYCVRAKNAVGYSAWSSYGYFNTLSSPGGTTPAPSTPVPGGTAGNSFSTATKLNASATSSTSYNGNLTSKTQNDYYVYTAAVSGIHLIKSSANIDIVGELFDSNQGSIVSDNNDKGDGKNFVMGYKFNAGTKFYIRVKGNGSSTGSYTLTVAPPKPPKSVLLYVGQYTGAQKYPEFTDSDINVLLKDGINTKDFIITDGGPGYNHYMENGVRKELVTAAAIENLNINITESNATGLLQIKEDYRVAYRRKVDATYTINDYVEPALALAKKMIAKDPEVQLWFSFPWMEIHALSENYVEPYKKHIYAAIKSKMSIKEWNRNVRGFYVGTEGVTGWYTKFNESNTTNFDNAVVKAMKAYSDLVHSEGKEMIWIPYYGASDGSNPLRVGNIANKTNIFDYIIIQPGKYFTDSRYVNKKTKELGEKEVALYKDNISHISKSFKAPYAVYTPKNVIAGGSKTSNTRIGMEMELDANLIVQSSYLDTVWTNWFAADGNNPRNTLWSTRKIFAEQKKAWYYEYETATNAYKANIPTVYYAGERNEMFRTNNSGQKEVLNIIKNYFSYNLW
jgi:SH3 domain protein